MRRLNKIGLVAAAVLLPLLLSAGAYLVARSSLAQTPPPVPSGQIDWNRSTPSPPGRTPTPRTSSEDVKGNCDEPEHAGDPQCQGVGSGSTSGSGTAGPAPAPSPTEDHRGRGGGDGGGDGGSNSGPGSGSSGSSGSSGPGGGDDSKGSGSGGSG